MNYYTCEHCAHYVAEPEHPSRCENCGAHATIGCRVMVTR